MIHVHQCVNPVGHGTFLTGMVYDDDCPEKSFSWVYDCGSKRTKRIKEGINDLHRWEMWPERVDLLILSHFDDDHVNGVEQFLNKHPVAVAADLRRGREPTTNGSSRPESATHERLKRSFNAANKSVACLAILVETLTCTTASRSSKIVTDTIVKAESPNPASTSAR